MDEIFIPIAMILIVIGGIFYYSFIKKLEDEKLGEGSIINVSFFITIIGSGIFEWFFITYFIDKTRGNGAEVFLILSAITIIIGIVFIFENNSFSDGIKILLIELPVMLFSVILAPVAVVLGIFYLFSEYQGSGTGERKIDSSPQEIKFNNLTINIHSDFNKSEINSALSDYRRSQFYKYSFFEEDISHIESDIQYYIAAYHEIAVSVNINKYSITVIDNHTNSAKKL